MLISNLFKLFLNLFFYSHEIEVIMLGGLEEDLHQLNDQFLKTVKEKNVKVMSWGEELLSNYGVMLHIVPPDTANPGKKNLVKKYGF